MRLMEHRILHPEDALPSTSDSIASDPSLYHYAIFSENIIAVSVVVNSVIRNAADPSRHVFHVVTDPMYLPAMQVLFIHSFIYYLIVVIINAFPYWILCQIGLVCQAATNRWGLHGSPLY